jgi:putative serine/threonine protein kinase
LNQEKKSISVEELAMEPYRILLSYPKVNEERVTKLTRELMEAGVSKILFIGRTKLDGLNVLGKGCTAIVFAAETVYGKAAVKVLRVDANRKTLEDEAKFLKMVNAYNIGPKLYHTSKDFIIMEYVEGKKISEYVRELKGKGASRRLKNVVKEMLEQAFKLDQNGIAHNELSNPLKHIIVDDKEKPVIIDFESATLNKKYSNLTALAQSLFIGGKISPKIRKIMNIKDKEKIVSALKEYKIKRDLESFKKVLESAKINF